MYHASWSSGKSRTTLLAEHRLFLLFACRNAESRLLNTVRHEPHIQSVLCSPTCLLKAERSVKTDAGLPQYRQNSPRFPISVALTLPWPIAELVLGASRSARPSAGGMIVVFTPCWGASLLDRFIRLEGIGSVRPEVGAGLVSTTEMTPIGLDEYASPASGTCGVIAPDGLPASCETVWRTRNPYASKVASVRTVRSL